MSGIYNRFKTDRELEKNSGILLNFGPNSKGKDFCIRVLRAGGANHAYEKRREVVTKPYRRQIQNDQMDTATLKELLKEIYVSNIVIGWENAEDEDGNDLVFNKENVEKLFADLPDIWDEVFEQAQKAALFRAHIMEEDAKN